jgi:hypothetical protein
LRNHAYLTDGGSGAWRGRFERQFCPHSGPQRCAKNGCFCPDPLPLSKSMD